MSNNFLAYFAGAIFESTIWIFVAQCSKHYTIRTFNTCITLWINGAANQTDISRSQIKGLYQRSRDIFFNLEQKNFFVLLWFQCDSHYLVCNVQNFYRYIIQTWQIQPTNRCKPQLNLIKQKGIDMREKILLKRTIFLALIILELNIFIGHFHLITLFILTLVL